MRITLMLNLLSSVEAGLPLTFQRTILPLSSGLKSGSSWFILESGHGNWTTLCEGACHLAIYLTLIYVKIINYE
jgi:hypothetical protein